ncbi:MAG: hypothetical protein PUP93_33900 [Rhizonema sp. NSF051]|nr:hypothetical protein [Rhizonema sp. NSF051]
MQKKYIAAIALSTIGIITGVGYLGFKPAHSEVIPQLNPALLKAPTEILHSNKDKQTAGFELPTQADVSAIMTPEAHQHLQGMQMMNFGDYEKTHNRKSQTISRDRQVWIVSQKFKDSENYQGLHGSFKGATVTNIVDAETGQVLGEDVVYPRGNFTPKGAMLQQPPQN